MAGLAVAYQSPSHIRHCFHLQRSLSRHPGVYSPLDYFAAFGLRSAQRVRPGELSTGIDEAQTSETFDEILIGRPLGRRDLANGRLVKG
jgi:hypothetical protein